MNGMFKKRLKHGDVLISTIVTLPSSDIGEIFSRAGFDWLFVDLEHSALSIRDAQVILQSASPTPCLIRVPSNDEAWIKKALDIGASGVVIPMIRSVEDAQKAVRLCRYPPDGSRSVGLARAHGYGEKFQEYISTANDDVAVVIQIEHIDAVDRIDDIARIEGIDGWFVGPYDLSASMGKPGDTTASDVLEAIGKVKETAKLAKLPLGIYCSTTEMAKACIGEGYAFLTVGIDTALIAQTAKHMVGCLKE